MNAAHPAARATLTFGEFADGTVDVELTGFGAFDGNNPTEPLVTGQRSNIAPSGQRIGRSLEGFAQVGRNIVGNAVWD